ncbi:MAG: TolC family protein, partial [Prevotella sp.]|nr:TolC family protein [Prevotella sp.]
MKKVFSFIIGLACCGSAAAQQTYTLDQLKQLAVENNFNLRSARNAIQQSKELKNEAFTKYFPTVSAVGAGVTMNKYLLEADLSLPDGLANLLPAGVSAAWPTNIAFMKNGVFGSVSAIQPVFMGGQIVNGNKLAKAGVEASEIQLEASEDQVELSTEQYYWQVVSLKEKLLTLNAIHQMLVELEKDVNNRVRVGAVNRND